MFCWCYFSFNGFFETDHIRRSGPIFIKFSGLVDMCVGIINLTLQSFKKCCYCNQFFGVNRPKLAYNSFILCTGITQWMGDGNLDRRLNIVDNRSTFAKNLVNFDLVSSQFGQQSKQKAGWAHAGICHDSRKSWSLLLISLLLLQSSRSQVHYMLPMFFLFHFPKKAFFDIRRPTF